MKSCLSMMAMLMLMPSLVMADTQACRKQDPQNPRPRIGLVLGGGGARGIAHVSVIKELERRHVPIDCIAGTSMGALIGGLYASGMSIEEIEKLVTTLDWPATFDDSLDRPERSFRRKRDDDLSLLNAKPGIGKKGIKITSGLLAGETVMLLLERLSNEASRSGNFDQLVIPFRAVATDINTGEAAVLRSGNLAIAMRASMSIPGVLRPVKIGDQLLVDGGIVNQVPVDVARAMGADILIVVDVGTPLAALDENASVLSFADQLGSLMTVGNTKKSLDSLRPGDILIQPALSDRVRTGDFDKAALALEIGDQSVKALDTQLAALARPGADKTDEKRIAITDKYEREKPMIEFVRLNNKTLYSDEVLLARLDIRNNQRFDVDKVEAAIRRVYGLGTLDSVTYDMVEENGKSGLVVDIKPQSYGPDYLETGVNTYSDFRGDFVFNVRAGVIRNPINALGGELRLLAQIGSEPSIFGEYFQPLDPKGRYFAGIKGGFENPQLNYFGANGNRIAQFELPSWGLDIYAGREFGNYGAATLGVRRRSGEANLLIGTTTIPDNDFDIGEAYWNITFDRLDSFQVPRSGTFLSFGQTYGREALGSDNDFSQFNLDLIYAHAIGVHSGYAGLRYHDTTSGTPLLQNYYRLGGVTRLPGYRPNELFVANYALGFVGYTYELGRLLNRPAIIGGTIEYADVWNDGLAHQQELNASAYFGFDSWLGRFLLGYGARENGEGSFFLELGRNR
ncbi:MAG TPA: patatin-like phospholipase family protein [Arenimonas sp.]|nr:patatin-like phospholipase family protein [Arenimonas sp.]